MCVCVCVCVCGGGGVLVDEWGSGDITIVECIL